MVKEAFLLSFHQRSDSVFTLAEIRADAALFLHEDFHPSYNCVLCLYTDL